MTEEIIKECEFYLPLSEDCNEILDDNGNEIYKCSQRQDCYYKQLKRLEQERDELKKTVENQKLEYEELQCDLSEVENACGCYQSENAELKQENKELKEINTALIQEAEDVTEARMEICNQCGNRDDYNIPCKMIRDLDYGLNITIEERDTYRSALEEINITVKQLLKGVSSNCINNTPYLTALSLIENKINECIE